MSTGQGGLSAREHSEMRDLVLAGTQRIRPAGAHRAQFIAIGVALVLVGAVTGGVVTATLQGDGIVEPVAPPDPSPTAMAAEGWVAYSSGYFQGDIYFVEAGSAPHRVIGSDDENLDQVCPAFAPDGTRLASGQATGDDQSGHSDPALVITELTAGGEAGASRAIPLNGGSQPPCPIWSPDGLWVAFGAESQPAGTYGVAREVVVVGVDTGEVRRVTGREVTDIEWTAGGSELYMATDDGIVVYSTADEQTRTLDDTEGAAALAASPDGASLAVERRRADSSDFSERFDLWLMDVDGSDQRLLLGDYSHGRGIGPVWSPDGKRIVFQRAGDTTVTHAAGQYPILGENDEVVIVTVGENDSLGPFGTQTVLAPIHTAEGSEPRRWLPSIVTWAPDSATLRFVGWELLASGDMGSGSGLLTVPVDATLAPTILWETAEGIGPMSIFPQNDFQSWSR